jgi:hypothetical protein
MFKLEKRPDWFYKILEIDNLEQIQKELVSILYSKCPDFDIPTDTIKYIPILKTEIEPHAPLYTNYIKSLGLLHKWKISLIVIVSNISKENIHIDHTDYNQRCYGLNLPLINCEDTYTVWYDAVLENKSPPNAGSLYNARNIRTDLPYHEIGRLEVSNPAWINVGIPHVGENKKDKPRAIISARFSPEVHERFIK